MNRTSKVFLTASLILILISGCKKIETGLPIGEGKNPIARGAVTTHNPNVPDSLKYSEAPEESPEEAPEEETETPGETGSSSCPSVDYPIFAGAGGNDTTKGANVGTVTYSNDAVNLYVTTTFSGPTCPKEIHLWAGTDPSTVTGSGGPAFGRFPYKLSSATCGTHTFTIPLSEVFAGEADFCNMDISIILHAAMGADQTEGGQAGGETAMGYGDETLGGSRWGWVATYPVCCAAPIFCGTPDHDSPTPPTIDETPIYFE